MDYAYYYNSKNDAINILRYLDHEAAISTKFLDILNIIKTKFWYPLLREIYDTDFIGKTEFKNEKNPSRNT